MFCLNILVLCRIVHRIFIFHSEIFRNQLCVYFCYTLFTAVLVFPTFFYFFSSPSSLFLLTFLSNFFSSLSLLYFRFCLCLLHSLPTSLSLFVSISSLFSLPLSIFSLLISPYLSFPSFLSSPLSFYQQ